MNERIEYIIDKAYAELHKEGSNRFFGQRTVVKKVAELIVRECADMAESFQRHQYDFTGDLELHEFMKKHFGVE